MFCSASVLKCQPRWRPIANHLVVIYCIYIILWCKNEKPVINLFIHPVHLKKNRNVNLGPVYMSKSYSAVGEKTFRQDTQIILFCSYRSNISRQLSRQIRSTFFIEDYQLPLNIFWSQYGGNLKLVLWAWLLINKGDFVYICLPFGAKPIRTRRFVLLPIVRNSDS